MTITERSREVYRYLQALYDAALNDQTTRGPERSAIRSAMQAMASVRDIREGETASAIGWLNDSEKYARHAAYLLSQSQGS